MPPSFQSVLTAHRWNRRDLMKAAGVAGLWPFLEMTPKGLHARVLRTENYPFQLGVASGEPLSDGVVIWTRLAPEPLEGNGGMPPEDVTVKWVVASDEKLTKVVRRGESVASADWAHSVHVEVDGLEPDRVYWYQFYMGDDASPLGRTRTAPAAGAMLDRFRFAFASCQHYEAGLYTAYEHMAKEDLNLVIHLGDYIYEGKAREGLPRQHKGKELGSLRSYRVRHAQYKSDLNLQAAHAAFPWLVTWDDHEVDNNYADDICSNGKIDPVEFLKRRANAYKAYYEHMPLRKASVPVGPLMQLYRSVNFGQLVEFQMLDTRQYRSNQPCGDKTAPPCDGVFDPAATMLGEQQENWLNKKLTSSKSQWNVLGQQVMIARVDRIPGPEIGRHMDQWGGYDVPRTRLLKFIDDNKVRNPVVLTGDIHCNWANDLKIDFDNEKAPVVATEFVGTSISSSGDGIQHREDYEGVMAENHFVRFYNGERGYVSCDINKDSWRTDYQTVEYVTRPGAPLVTRASFEVENDRPGAQQV